VDLPLLTFQDGLEFGAAGPAGLLSLSAEEELALELEPAAPAVVLHPSSCLAPSPARPLRPSEVLGLVGCPHRAAWELEQYLKAPALRLLT